MDDFEITNALIAIGFGVFVLVVIVPLLAVILLTVFDAIFRQDIGFSRLVWLGAVLMIPVGGLLAYWMLRPKDFDPLTESREAAFPRHLVYAGAPAGHVAMAPPTPIRREQPAASPAAPDAGEEPEEKAA